MLNAIDAHVPAASVCVVRLCLTKPFNYHTFCVCLQTCRKRQVEWKQWHSQIVYLQCDADEMDRMHMRWMWDPSRITRSKFFAILHLIRFVNAILLRTFCCTPVTLMVAGRQAGSDEAVQQCIHRVINQRRTNRTRKIGNRNNLLLGY